MGEIIVYGIVALVILGIASIIITCIIENWILVLCVSIVFLSVLIFLALRFKKIRSVESLVQEIVLQKTLNYTIQT